MPAIIIDVVTDAIVTVTRAEVEAEADGIAYLVPMTPGAVLRWLGEEASIDVIRVAVSPDGKSITLTEPGRPGTPR